MGCVSSKFFTKPVDDDEDSDALIDPIISNPKFTSKMHVVSLTSSTLGVLRLDSVTPPKRSVSAPEISVADLAAPDIQKMVVEEPEVINAWELMGDLEEAMPKSVSSTPGKKQVLGIKSKTPSPKKVFNEKICSPKKPKRNWGKENKTPSSSSSPSRILRPLMSLQNPKLSKIGGMYKYPSLQTTPNMLKKSSYKRDSGFCSSSRRSLSPLFDPELLAMFEKELSEGEEQIKMMISPKLRNNFNKSWESESLLGLYEKKCPLNGEQTVVIYTTTLRGIRKTFEECNVVRSIIESHNVHMIERDISMDSGFREDLRTLLGKKDVRVPVVFVKGRLIGGSEELVKLEELGKLGILFDGIPKAMVGCEGCAGIRFIMCMDCCGSCRVLDPAEKKYVKCGECNENGLIQCPICC